MSEAKRQGRPIGYWLKKADAVLTSRIDEAHRGSGLSRFDWQILNSLHPDGAAFAQLTAALEPFMTPLQLNEALDRLAKRGLIEGGESNVSSYRLTRAGEEAHAAALSRQKAVREQAMTGISEADYATAVRVLRRIVENFYED